MKSVAAAIISIVLGASAASVQSSQMVTVTHPGSQPSTGGPADNFTGSVRVDSRFQGTAPARISGGIVTFEPGARTAWHTHPLGQTLIVTAGVGLVQEWDGAVQEIRPGDIVWIPPGVKHWHGATAINGMSHIAFSEALDGKTVALMEQASEEQYRRELVAVLLAGVLVSADPPAEQAACATHCDLFLIAYFIEKSSVVYRACPL
jgi:quercetin dioxygenase-like cupin family protein